MMQFLNNIWIALSTENAELVNILLIPAGIIESFLFINLILIIYNIKIPMKNKWFYIICIALLGIFSLIYIPSPLNVILNYTLVLFLIKFFFKINILKSFLLLIISLFIFVLLNILFQNPYLTILNISTTTFINTPIYRITYLIIVYSFLFIISILLKRFKRKNYDLDIFDNLDKKTLILLYINLFIGFLTLCIQLVTTAFYIDIVPIIISILNFILLISFLLLSIYSFTRMIKLANARKDLKSAEDYNKSLEILYNKVNGFKHDFDINVATLDGFIQNNDMPGLKKYFTEVKKDCRITNNLSILNPKIINNPGIYSLLNSKYFKATKANVNFELEFFLDLDTLNVNIYEFSRMLGILIDNAIEEAQKCTEKIVKVIFRRENKNHRAIIIVENTYSNKNVDTEKIFEKGVSGKKNHSGIGLWEVRHYVEKSKNLDLFTTKNNSFFIQELSIYDY